MAIDASNKRVFAELGLSTDIVEPQAPMTLDVFRSVIDVFMARAGEPAKVPFKDSTVPARDGYAIPIRMFHPDLDDGYPVLIFYPGSGYVLKSFELNAIAASRIADYAHCKVIVVDYRLCPEHSLPVPYHDAYDASAYIAHHPNLFHIDPANLFIAGISSGAHAAAQVASMSRQDDAFFIKEAILVNGVYDLSLQQNAYAHFEEEDKMCTRTGLHFMLQQFGLNAEQLGEAQYSPLLNADIDHMPPITLLIGEYDGLRSDSEAYYNHLASDPDNTVNKIILTGQGHNTLCMRGAMTDGDDPAEVIANIIKEHNKD